MQLPKLSTTAKIGIGWTAAVSSGLYAFYLSKQQIDKNRYESMKVRERLRTITQEEYTPVRNFKIPEITSKSKPSE